MKSGFSRRPDAPTFVPYHFLLGPRSHVFPPTGGRAEADLGGILPETKAAVAHLVEQRLGRPLTDAEAEPGKTFER